MPQKHALMRAMAFVQPPFYCDGTAKAAARGACVISWLRDMNWHFEATALEKKIRSNPDLTETFTKLQKDTAKMSEIRSAATLLNWIYGWGLSGDEWRATKGTALIEELWAIINSMPEKSACRLQS